MKIRSPIIIQPAQGILKKAFTLVELLVVVVIISLLMGLVVPVMNGISQANQISLGIQTVVDTLSLARQSALAQNRVVEVRFYKFKSEERMAAEDEVAALQIFVYDETNTIATPAGEVKYLPHGAVISSDSNLSSLIASSQQKSWSTQDPQLPLPQGVENSYVAYRLRFRPDGSTDLGAGEWFLTVHGTNDTGSPPPNHAVIQIDPYNGSLRLYRPN